MTESIGTYYVDVRPDARGFVERLRQQTDQAGDESGRAFGDRFSRAARDRIIAGLRDLPDARVGADTSAAQRQLDELRARIARQSTDVRVNVDKKSTQQLSLMRDAIIALGPAAVPVAAVAAGALAGLLPVAASVVLGVKGISTELKSGQLAGTQYARDFAAVRTELTDLQQTAARGLLPGLDSAIQSSRPLFASFNQEIGRTSSQLGSIAAGAGPAILHVLTQLGPLFDTIGNDLVAGAQKFEHWASSTDSITKFVQYVQHELPQVEHTLGELLTLAGHLVQGFAPFGSTVVRLLGAASSAINALPVGVLSDLESVVLSGYAAWRVYGGVSAVVNFVNGALAKHAATVAATAAQVEASTLAQEATVAEAAAAEATARAELAAEVAASQAAIVAALAGTGSAFEAEAVAAATASAEEAVAFQAAADAALTASAEISAAATAAAETAATAGAAAGVGFSAMLGPVAAVVAGVALLGITMFGSSEDTHAATAAQDEFTQSVKESTNALNGANIQATLKSLSDTGALYQLSLTSLKGHISDVVQAVNGSSAAYDNFMNQLAAADGMTRKQFDTYVEQIDKVGKVADAYANLGHSVRDLRGQLSADIQAQILFQNSQIASAQSLDGGAQAAADQAAALGLSKTAYLNAQIAAQTNTQKTDAQTQAFQLENDAASLLTQTLDKLSGRTIGTAEAATALRAANLAVTDAIKQNGTAIQGGSAKAVANQQAFEGQARAAIAYAEAIGKATGSSKAETNQLRASRDALEANLKAHGQLTPQLKTYIDSLYSLSKIHVPPTKIDADATQAKSKIHDMQAAINAIRQGRVPGIDAETRDGKNAISALQKDIDQMKQHHKPTVDAYTDDLIAKVREAQRYLDSLRNKTVTITASYQALRGPGSSTYQQQVPGSATGSGPGGLPAGWSTVGERGWEAAYTDGGRTQIFDHRTSMQLLGMPDQIPGYASGTSSAHISDLNAVTGDVKALMAALFGATAQLATAENTLAHAADKAGAAQSILNTLADQRVTLLQDSALLARTTAQVTKAQDYLNGLQTKYRDLESSVAGTTGAFDITSAGVRSSVYNDVAAPPVSITTITADAHARAAQAVLEREQLAAARKKGLNLTDYQQLAAGDPTQEAAQLKALAAATPAQIKAYNAARATLQRVSGFTGRDVAGQVYGSQLDTARALLNGFNPATNPALAGSVKALANSLFGAGKYAARGLSEGLLDEKSGVQTAMKHLADVMVSEIEHGLDMHSPSRKLHARGLLAARSVAMGLDAGLPDIADAAARMAVHAQPVNLQPSAAQGGAAARGGLFGDRSITIHAVDTGDLLSQMKVELYHDRARASVGAI